MYKNRQEKRNIKIITEIIAAMNIFEQMLASTNINMVKQDVLPFIQAPKEIDIGSNNYFLQLADRIKYQQENKM